MIVRNQSCCPPALNRRAFKNDSPGQRDAERASGNYAINRIQLAFGEAIVADENKAVRQPRLGQARRHHKRSLVTFQENVGDVGLYVPSGIKWRAVIVPDALIEQFEPLYVIQHAAYPVIARQRVPFLLPLRLSIA